MRGLSSTELRTLRDTSLGRDEWHALFRVEVDGVAGLPISGTYLATDTALTFIPRFAFDRGRPYRVTIDPSRLLPPRTDPRASTIITFPVGDRTATRQVVGIHPSGDTVPENLLRIYLSFSGPMSSTGGLAYVRLLDDRDREVKAAFLPLEAEFWNRERTRYTMFLDPGRVKQGLVPNEQLGRALVAGRRYAIVVDTGWRDADGLPLAVPFRHEFVVTKADETVVDTKTWRVTPPAAKSNGALVVTFPDPLDHGLLMRAVGVETAKGESVDGDVEVARGEREWRFTPRTPWKPGDYRIVVLTILEDPSGNQVDKKFEVDMFERVDRSAVADRRYLPFSVR